MRGLLCVDHALPACEQCTLSAREMLDEVRQEVSNICARFAYTDEADVCQPLDELESKITKYLKGDL